jgi:tetratricopeptide (TPR) repeat protein
MISEENFSLFSRALKYVEKNPNKAVSLFKAFLKEHDCKEAWLNLSVAYKHLNKYELSGEALIKANDPSIPFSDGTFAKVYPTALNNLGLIAYGQGDAYTAEKFYRMCLSAEPLNYDCLWNLSITKLQNYCSDLPENLNECWKLYSYRFQRTGADPLKNNKRDLKLWDGISVVKSIVVLSEQGIGDSIMFARYLEKLKEYCGEIWIQCDPSLNYLFSDYQTCITVEDSFATHGIPLGSLGKLLDYIPPGEWLANKRVIEEHSGLRIGCVWAGNSKHVNDKNRSTSPFFFNKLKKYASLYTIGPASGPMDGFTHLPGVTWEDTIKNLSTLDLVITVDTSIAHLCGALGMPCWVLMPLYDGDFRWGNSSMGTKNVWYPSVSIVRNPGSWLETFEQVEKMLCEV